MTWDAVAQLKTAEGRTVDLGASRSLFQCRYAREVQNLSGRRGHALVAAAGFVKYGLALEPIQFEQDRLNRIEGFRFPNVGA